MRIEFNRKLLTGPTVEAVFWSFGVLCCLHSPLVGRLQNPTRERWTASIRLPADHPRVGDTALWQATAEQWAAGAVALRWQQDSTWNPDCAVNYNWLLLNVQNAQVQLMRRACSGTPERYWYVRDQPKRGVKKYKLAVRYMESLCCAMCREIQELAADRCGSAVC